MSIIEVELTFNTGKQSADGGIATSTAKLVREHPGVLVIDAIGRDGGEQNSSATLYVEMNEHTYDEVQTLTGLAWSEKLGAV